MGEVLQLSVGFPPYENIKIQKFVKIHLPILPAHLIPTPSVLGLPHL